MYVRKSTESDDRQVLSIPAQERELQLVAARHGLSIVGEPVREQQSAKTPGRPLFASVIARVRRGEAQGILCWHLDRLARNPTDGAAIMQDLSDRRLKAVYTPDRTYTGTGDDGLMMCIIFGMATKYSVDLGNNIRRGYAEAAARGQWPCAAVPVGYVRDPLTKACIPDPQRWDSVVEMWRRRVAGESVADIVRFTREALGLRARHHRSHKRDNTSATAGNLLSRSHIYTMLNDPFYAGLVVWKGKVVQGLHKAMITPREYYESQLDKRVTRPGPVYLPYRGLLTCGACGGTIVAERHVKKSGLVLSYYRCVGTTRSPRRCNEPAAPRRLVESTLREAMQQAVLPQRLVALVIDELSIAQQRTVDLNAAVRAQREAKVRTVRERNGRLVQAFLAGLISEDEMAEEKTRNQTLEAHAVAQLEEQQDMVKVLELLKNTILSQNDAVQLFDAADDDKKSAIAGALCSNLRLLGRNLSAELKEPFRTLAEIAAKSYRIEMEGSSSTEVSEIVDKLVLAVGTDEPSDANSRASPNWKNCSEAPTANTSLFAGKGPVEASEIALQ